VKTTQTEATILLTLPAPNAAPGQTFIIINENLNLQTTVTVTTADGQYIRGFNTDLSFGGDNPAFDSRVQTVHIFSDGSYYYLLSPFGLFPFSP